jgi:hypothetical protein
MPIVPPEEEEKEDGFPKMVKKELQYLHAISFLSRALCWR